MRETIFERYGGFAVVSRIVSDFYDQVLNTPDLVGYFDGVDTATLIDHQTKFIASLMGGPASYTNEHLDRVHKHLGITNDAFDETSEILRETLEDHDFDESDISQVVSQVQIRRSFIVHG